MTKVFISVELKSKYFAASCGKARWDDACVAEYLQKAVSNGNCWRFGGFVVYTLSILRNQKGLFQEPPAVWIDFQEPEAVWGHFPQWNFVVVGTSLCRGGIAVSPPQEPRSGYGEIAINLGIDKTFVTA